jgi:hypothetical protein
LQILFGHAVALAIGTGADEGQLPGFDQAVDVAQTGVEPQRNLRQLQHCSGSGFLVDVARVHHLLPLAQQFKQMTSAEDALKIVILRFHERGVFFGTAEHARFVG